MVPPYSDRISRVPPYLSQAQYHTGHFTYGAITRYGRSFQIVPLSRALSLTGCSDFARHYYRNLGWCLFLELLRCFSSPGSPRMTMNSSCDTFAGGFPHSEILGYNVYLPTFPSLSQAITSFFAYHRQGIHHMLLFTWPYNFNFSCENKALSRNVWLVFHQSRYAVPKLALGILEFQTRSLIFVTTQSKNCCWRHGASTPLVSMLSVSNADSTL